MNELIQRVIERTGLPEDKAAAAVQTVIGFLKEKLPGPVASQLDGVAGGTGAGMTDKICLLYTSPSPRDVEESRMPSSA